VCFIKPSSQAQTTYYVDAVSGSDGNSGISPGLAWKSVSKVNRSTLVPGDTILFKRGQTWREGLKPTSSGAASKWITFGAYGTGNKPLLLGSFDKSLTSDWTKDTGNIWKSTAKFNLYEARSFPDVGNIIFNNGGSCGTKRMTSKYQCVGQGDFYHSLTDSLVYMYSISNPGTVYTNIEVAPKHAPSSLREANIYVENKRYLTFENLDLRYAGAFGISLTPGSSYITVQNCNFAWIGGAIQDWADDSLRYGNGFQTWNSGTDITVRYCTFDQIYDAAFTSQGETASSVFRRHRYHHNLVTRAWAAAEFWHKGISSIVDSILVENNTFAGIGRCWSRTQRPDSLFNAVLAMGLIKGAWTNFYVRNNIFFDPYTSNNAYDRQVCIFVPSTIPDTVRARFTIDYNRYYEPSYTMIRWNDVSYTQGQFAKFQETTKQERHGSVGDPLFRSSTDFHLAPNSPCKGAGVYVGLDADHEGNPIRGVPSIGAFEEEESALEKTRDYGVLTPGELLAQNYPNPFNPTTSIHYRVPESGFVSIGVYDVIGRLVRTLVNEEKEKGSYRVVLDASNLASGFYWYRMQVGSLIEARTCIVLR